jgi:hypothetical protein
MNKSKKHMFYLFFGSAVWALCIAAHPGSQSQGFVNLPGLQFNVGQAYATDFSGDELVCVDRDTVTTEVGFKVSDDDKMSTTSTVLCHVSHGKGGKDHITLTLADKSVGKHMDKHEGDHLGACAGTEAPDETAVDTVCIDTLAGCTALGGASANGIWIPQSAVNADGSVNVTLADDYFTQTCASGGSGTPDSMHRSYRDIHGK